MYASCMLEAWADGCVHALLSELSCPLRVPVMFTKVEASFQSWVRDVGRGGHHKGVCFATMTATAMLNGAKVCF